MKTILKIYVILFVWCLAVPLQANYAALPNTKAITPPEGEQYAGVWVDISTNSKHTVKIINNIPVVVSVVSSSGEKYQVKESTWSDGALKWVYYVPSTEYTLTFTTKRISGDKMWCDWKNQYTSGDQEMHREAADQQDDLIQMLDKKNTQSGDNDLVGVWEDQNTKTKFTVEMIGGTPKVTSAIDDDGEVFEIRKSTYNDGVLKWTYYVPSTKYTVYKTVTSVSGDVMKCDWSNDHDKTGSGELHRLPADDNAQKLIGYWKDTDTKTIFTIEMKNGVPTVTAAIDDDLEVCRITSSTYSGSILKWTYYVPSTDVSIDFTLKDVSQYKMNCRWSNTSGSSGDQEFERMSATYTVSSSSEYVGVWEDQNTKTRFTVEMVGGDPKVTAAIDDDGEVFEVKKSTFLNNTLKWTYYVPSTKYTVYKTITSISGDVMQCDWSNDHNANGSGELRRVSSQSGNDKAQMLIGKWEDQGTKSIHTIEMKGGVPTVVSIVDDDGEVMVVKKSTWSNGVLKEVYYCPSTKYTVTIETKSISQDRIATKWSNDHDATGSEDWIRVTGGSDASLNKYLGKWEDENTKTIFTIELIGGVPKVTSAIDDDGEVFTVKKSTFNGGVLKWTYYVPSTKYTVNKTVTSVVGDKMATDWSNDHSGSGSANLYRKSSGFNNVDKDQWLGIWKDLDSKTEHLVELVDGVPTVTLCVDDDNEQFPIETSDWNGDGLDFAYLVPSTGYVVHVESKSIQNDKMTCHWYNNHNKSGDQDYEKVMDKYDFQAYSDFVGIWEDDDTKTRHLVWIKDGEPTVIASLSSSGEEYEVKRSYWSDGVLEWSYYVPSTGYTVKLESTLALGTKMWCNWDNSENSGEQAFTRVSNMKED